MEISEEESVGYYKMDSEATSKMQGEPSNYHSITSSSRQNNSPISQAIADQQSKKGRNYEPINLDDLLNNFWGNDGNQVAPNSNQDTSKQGEQNLSDGGENEIMRDDQIFEQVGDGQQIIARNENERSNSDVSEAGASNGRRRSASYDQENTFIDKRQRRMIKNRESAQRSRARKQAYTAELEIELNRLREENEKLKLLVAQVATSRREREEEEKKEPTKAQWMANKLKTLRRNSSV